MDKRLRELERAAATGDPLAAERLGAAKCRIGEHFWTDYQRCARCNLLMCDTGVHIYVDHVCRGCCKKEPSLSLIQAVLQHYTIKRINKYPRQYQTAATCYDKKGRVCGRAWGWPKGRKKAPKWITRQMKKQGLYVQMFGLSHLNKHNGKWKDLSSEIKKEIGSLTWYSGGV